MSDFTVRNFVVGGTAPGSPSAGDMWYNTTTGSLLQHNGTIWQGVMLEYIQDVQNQVAAATYGVTHTIFVAPNTGETWQVAGASVSFGTASSSGTIQVEVATGTQAAGSGTNQLTGTMSTAGTANTAVNGTVVASPIAIAAGNRINLVFGGTQTGLANCCVTVILKKLT